MQRCLCDQEQKECMSLKGNHSKNYSFIENISAQYLTLPSKTPKSSGSPDNDGSVVV